MAQTELAQALAGHLAEFVAALQPAGSATASPSAVPKEHLSRLAGLGYVDMPGEEQPTTTTPAPDD